MQLYVCVSQQSHMQMIRYIQSLEEDVTIYSNVYFMSFLILKILFLFKKRHFILFLGHMQCEILHCLAM